MLKHILFQFVSQFGYIGIFGSMMLGMIGLPIPDELLMTFAGYLVFKGRLVYLTTLIVASLGAVSGVSFSFLLANKWGLPLLEKHGRKLHITPERLKKSEVWFQRFGKFAVTFSYFIPGVRHFTAISAGISRWSYRAFLLYAAPGGILWAATFVTLGYYLGEHWRVFTETLHKYMLYSVLGIAATAIIWWMLRRSRHNGKEKYDHVTPQSRSIVTHDLNVYSPKEETLPTENNIRDGQNDNQCHTESVAFIHAIHQDPLDENEARDELSEQKSE